MQNRPLRNFDLLIFDWDGTLANSVSTIVGNVQAGIAALGLPLRSDEEVANMIGISPFEGIRRLYPELNALRVLAQLREQRRKIEPRNKTIQLFAGVEEALQLLQSRALLAVATGKDRPSLNSAMADVPAVTSLFKVTRCADETAAKPDPAMLREIVAHCGVSIDRCLMIGDTSYDAAMATAIGMTAVGVASGVHSAEVQLAAGALEVIESVAVLPAWLESK